MIILCGVLAPNAPLRSAVTALAAPPAETPAMAAPVRDPSRKDAEEPIHCRVARYARALLFARIYEVFPLPCPKCGGEIRIIAFITEAAVVRGTHRPTAHGAGAGASLWEVPVAGLGGDLQAQAAPDYEFDQRGAW